MGRKQTHHSALYTSYKRQSDTTEIYRIINSKKTLPKWLNVEWNEICWDAGQYRV